MLCIVELLHYDTHFESFPLKLFAFRIQCQAFVNSAPFKWAKKICRKCTVHVSSPRLPLMFHCSLNSVSAIAFGLIHCIKLVNFGEVEKMRMTFGLMLSGTLSIILQQIEMFRTIFDLLTVFETLQSEKVTLFCVFTSNAFSNRYLCHESRFVRFLLLHLFCVVCGCRKNEQTDLINSC